MQTLVACDSDRGEPRAAAPVPATTAPPPQPVAPPPPVSPPPQPVAAPPPSVPESKVHGHFRGGASTDDALYYVDAVVTVDGAVRMHLAGPYERGSVFSGAGFPVSDDPAESVLLVGKVETIGDENLGEGVVLGQICAPSDPGRFCDAPAPASISIAKSPGGAAGELRVTTNRGEEVWLLSLDAWSLYYRFDPYISAADPYRGPRGQFREWLAAFADAEDTVVTVDGGGRFFFQSPKSGCVGNGTLARHDVYYVFDVDLLIESCNPSHAFLNGAFEGLATETQSGWWDYDNTLLVFLSAPEGSAPRPAITMLAGQIY